MREFARPVTALSSSASSPIRHLYGMS
jgi:hypothetical protein